MQLQIFSTRKGFDVCSQATTELDVERIMKVLCLVKDWLEQNAYRAGATKDPWFAMSIG